MFFVYAIVVECLDGVVVFFFSLSFCGWRWLVDNGLMWKEFSEQYIRLQFISTTL